MAIFARFFCHSMLLLYLSCQASETMFSTSISKPVPVQMSTLTSSGVFRILRDDLAFHPPDNRTYILKQQWRESGQSPEIFVSLQIVQGSQEENPNDRKLFLTRSAVAESYPSEQKIGSFSEDKRLFKSRCCGCGSTWAPVTYYWPKEEPMSTVGFLTVTKGSNSELTLDKGSGPAKRTCRSSNLQINEYPYVERQSGAPHPKASPTESASSLSTNKIPVRFVTGSGSDRFVVGVKESEDGSLLYLSPNLEEASSTETTFFYDGYKEYHVDTDGSIVSRDCFTLQHEATLMYIVADVDESASLKMGTQGTGLNLQRETEFDPQTPTSPDYRFFVRYDMSNMDTSTQLERVNADDDQPASGRTQTRIVCPLFHRRYCMEPSNGEELRLELVARSSPKEFLFPSLTDPPVQIGGQLESSTTMPTFDFIPV